MKEIRKITMKGAILFLALVFSKNSQAQCGSCNDGNPCTVDSCHFTFSPTGQIIFLGCIHINTCSSLWYYDNDDDGYGDPLLVRESMTKPTGYVSNKNDCNDQNAAINPLTLWYLDGDNDGYYFGTGITQCNSPGSNYKYAGLLGGGDCKDNPIMDPTAASIHPNAQEVCGNNVDENCDGSLVYTNTTTPTGDDFIVTLINPPAFGCRGKILISYAYQGCWASYRALLSKKADFMGILEDTHDGSPQNNNHEFLSDGQGFKAGTYYVMLTDNNGNELKKTVTLVEPTVYDANANISYTYTPLDLNTCLGTLTIKLNTKDCFDKWYTTLRAYSSDGSLSTIVLYDHTDLEAAENIGSDIVYEIHSVLYSVFKIQSTRYNSGGETDNVLPEKTIEIPPFNRCQGDVEMNILQLPSTHCSKDGIVSFTTNTTNTCYDEMNIYLKWSRINPDAEEAFEHGIKFSVGRTLTFSNLKAGYYEALIGIAGPTGMICSLKKTFTIGSVSNTQDLSFLTPTIKHVNCVGDNSGSITANVVGGTGQYKYSWTDGQKTKTARNLPVGDYYVTVTDGIGCVIKNNKDNAYPIVATNNEMSVEKSQTNVTTIGGKDGTATVNVSYGTPPFSFRWNTHPPQTGSGSNFSTATNLKAGTYTVTIRDQRGCEKKETFIITEPALATRINSNTMTVQDYSKEESTEASPLMEYKEILNEHKNSFTISPNPANKVVTINIKNNLAAGNINLLLIDQAGRVIKKWSHQFYLPPKISNLDISDVRNGLYILTIKDRNGKQLTEKLIINH